MSLRGAQGTVWERSDAGQCMITLVLPSGPCKHFKGRERSDAGQRVITSRVLPSGPCKHRRKRDQANV
eukprot:1159828-Pelagomonas_calceolata.AAC.16